MAGLTRIKYWEMIKKHAGRIFDTLDVTEHYMEAADAFLQEHPEVTAEEVRKYSLSVAQYDEVMKDKSYPDEGDRERNAFTSMLETDLWKITEPAVPWQEPATPPFKPLDIDEARARLVPTLLASQLVQQVDTWNADDGMGRAEAHIGLRIVFIDGTETIIEVVPDE